MTATQFHRPPGDFDGLWSVMIMFAVAALICGLAVPP